MSKKNRVIVVILFSFIAIFICTTQFTYIKSFCFLTCGDNFPQNESYRQQVVNAQLTWFASGVKVYYAVNHTFPQSNGVPNLLLEQGGVFYGDSKRFSVSPKDPWGGEVMYTMVNSKAIISSAGKDRIFDSADDISYIVSASGSEISIQTKGQEIESRMIDTSILRWTCKER